MHFFESIAASAVNYANYSTYGGGRAGSSSEGEVVVGQVRTHLAIAVRQRLLVVACPIAKADVALRPGRTLTVRLVLPQVRSEPLGVVGCYLGRNRRIRRESRRPQTYPS